MKIDAEVSAMSNKCIVDEYDRLKISRWQILEIGNRNLHLKIEDSKI